MSTQWVTKRTRKGPTDEANSTIDFSMIQNDGTLNHGFCEEEEPSMSAPGGAMTSISTQTDPKLKPSMENWNLLIHLSKENHQLTEENEKLKRSAAINSEVLATEKAQKKKLQQELDKMRLKIQHLEKDKQELEQTVATLQAPARSQLQETTTDHQSVSLWK